MAHCTIQEAEEILDKEFPVLDKGFVRLVDYLGGDERIVQAARVSYGKGTKTYREDRGLISYLLRNRHTSPFEQVIFTFHVKLPIFVARQWIRHRTARLNEISGRYSVMKDEFFLPRREDIALQSEDNKQGRSEDAVPEDLKDKVLDHLRREQTGVYEGYKELIDDGVARELARVNLPLSTYTEWYWQIDLHNLFHFIELRMDPHAQKEIRVYAEVLFDIMKKVCPLAGEAFEEHLVGAVAFSRKEFDALKKMLAGGGPESSGLKGKDQERFLRKLETGRQE